MVRFALYITAAIGLAGCGQPSQIRVPLVDPTNATEANVLVGVYSLTQENGEIHYLHVGKASKGYPANFLKILWVADTAQDGLGAIDWPVFACKINQSYILHIPLPKNFNLQSGQSIAGWTKSWEETEVSGYMLLQVHQSDAGLSVAGIKEDYWVSAIASGELQGVVTPHSNSVDKPVREKVVDITSGRTELRRFIEEHCDDAFEKKATSFRRISIR